MNGNNHTFSLDILSEESNQTPLDGKVVDNMKQLIVNTFSDRGIAVSLISCVVGPTVVRFELVPDKAYKFKKIRSCEESLNEALSDYGPIRLIAPVPAKGTIAVEVPRSDRQIVRLREMLESKEFQESKAHLPIALGIDSENNMIVADLAKMPHLLIAEATSMGKSMLINNVILSLLYRLNPVDLRLVLIAPKRFELAPFDKIKSQYLLQVGDDSPEVITDISKVPDILTSTDNEVQYRYNLFRKAGCRTIQEYNQKIAEGKQTSNQLSHLPYIVVIVDEFANLIIKYGKEFEIPLLHIAQKGRAVGIHVIISTQRPTTDVITGIIKANFPARIAFKVCSEIDSKTILDTTNGQLLLGMGDMLLNNNGSFKRIQSCYIDSLEIESICDWIAHHFPKDDSCIMPFNSKKLDGLLDTIEFYEAPYRFPYEHYTIIGDTAEINQIINTCGVINLDAADIESTLSKDAVNYVVVGFGKGDDCMTDALKDAIGKLPIGVEVISKLLFNIWILRDMPSSGNCMNSLAVFVKDLSKDIDICWGCAYDESMDGRQARVSLIAASK